LNKRLLALGGLGALGILLFSSFRSASKQLVCNGPGPWLGTQRGTGTTIQTCYDPQSFAGQPIIILPLYQGADNVVIPISQLPSLGYIEAVPGTWMLESDYRRLKQLYDNRRSELLSQSFSQFVQLAGEGVSLYNQVSGGQVVTDLQDVMSFAPRFDNIVFSTVPRQLPMLKAIDHLTINRLN